VLEKDLIFLEMGKEMKLISFVLMALTAFPSSFSWAGQRTCTLTETLPVQQDAEQKSHSENADLQLDVIWVIDDSSSMQTHQSNLKENIRHFFKVLDEEKSVDYQMGIVTTGLRVVMDQENGQPVRLMSSATSEERKEFMKQLLVGTVGNPSEKGTEAIFEFIHSQANVIRTGSQVQINILTDEDDETDVHGVHLARSLLQKLQSEGHQVTINLIAIGGSTKRYQQHLHGFDLHFYPLLSDDFSKDIRKLAAKSIGRTVLDFELQFKPKKIISILKQINSGRRSILHHDIMNDHVLRVDLGVIPLKSVANVEITYLYRCSAINRAESKKLIKKIAEIDFIPNQDVFLNPDSANETIQDVFEFLKKHDDTRISLVGAVSYPGNPLVWAKMMIVDPKDLPNAYRVAKSRSKKIETELIARGISPDRIRSKGAFPGMHRHWYSYLLDMTFYDLVSEFCVSCDIESDRRVIMKIRQK